MIHPLFAKTVVAAIAVTVANATAEQRVPVPGSYGPVFQEPGFNEKGGYFDAGFQTTVNHYGGNLLVTALDVSIPSQGGFGLFFRRTHNSNRTLSLTQTILNQGDGPLGMSWTAHYGLLWIAAPGQDLGRPELVDGTGARRVFHQHNRLHASIPTGSANAAWISSELEILTRTNDDNWVLRTPEGLTYDFTRLPQYVYLVPTRVTDFHGNAWEITYDSMPNPYFEHPLPATVTDGFGRMLRFRYLYQPPAKKRLQYVELASGPAARAGTRSSSGGGPRAVPFSSTTPTNPTFTATSVPGPSTSSSSGGGPRAVPFSSTTPTNPTWTARSSGPSTSSSGPSAPSSARPAGSAILAEYIVPDWHTPDGNFAFLWKHFTGARRETQYWYDLGSVPRFGTITKIQAPTGGLTEIGYDDRQFFFAGQLVRTYAVTSLTRGGHTWTFVYPTPQNSSSGDFTVEVRVDNDLVGSYTYNTYSTASPCAADVWKVGTLRSLTETFNNTTRSRDLDYGPFIYSQAPYIDNCAHRPTIARLNEETVVQDGTALTTRYGDYDDLNFAGQIDAPGNVVRTLEFRHVTTPSRYQLGLKRSEAIRASGVLVQKTVWDYPSVYDVLPNRIKFFRDEANFVDVKLSYHNTGNGKLGALKKKEYGQTSVLYDYQNGVVKSADFAEDPDISREINPNGTIIWETRNGVTRNYRWDGDFRPTFIDNPDHEADVWIQYPNRHVVTISHLGTSTQQLLTYDDFGRLIERRTRIQASPPVDGYETFDAFDAFDRATRQKMPSGAEYELAYDVEGRLTWRSAPEDTHYYEYFTTATGVVTRHTMNNAVVRVLTNDHLGRPLRGELNGPSVTTSHSYDTGSPAGIRSTMQPDGQQPHRLIHDFFGTLVAENHPETGRVTYGVSPEGWINGLTSPTANFNYDLDKIGRIAAVRNAAKVGAPVFLERAWDTKHGRPKTTEFKQFGKRVLTEYLPDSMGRPANLRITIPRALEAPVPTYPWPWGQLSGVPQQGDPGHDPNFRWDAVSGASEYQLELRQPTSQTDCDGGVLRWRGRVTPAGATSMPFPVQLANNTPYCFRVRAQTAEGEIGPFSYWVMFKLGGVPRWDPAAIPPTVVSPTTPEAVFEVNFQYDSLGRIQEIKHPDFDPSLNPNTALGGRQGYTFNATDGHEKVTFRGGGDVTAREIVERTTYATTGDVARMSIPLLGYGLSDAWRSVIVDRTHDDLGRLRSLKIAEGQTAHYDAPTIAYNEWGFVKSLTRSDVAFSGGMSYNYDPGGRLRRFTVNGVPVMFGYDAAGNLTSQTALSVGPLSLPAFQGLTYDTDNRLIGWTYDAGGRLEADSKFNYKYNELDQIVDVREGDWVVAQYLYDADGYRVREVYDGRVVYSVRGLNHELLSQETQTVLYPGDTSFYFWPDGQRLPERRDFIYHNGVPLAEMILRGDALVVPVYTFRDRLGSPVVELSGYGDHDLHSEYTEYAPYGQQMRPAPYERDTTQEFTGQERDEISGLDYFKQRYYQPQYGRFNRPDPARDFDPTNLVSYNMYAYARANPVNFTDPLGLKIRVEGPEGIAAYNQLKQDPVYRPVLEDFERSEYINIHIRPGRKLPKAGKKFRGAATSIRGRDKEFACGAFWLHDWLPWDDFRFDIDIVYDEDVRKWAEQLMGLPNPLEGIFAHEIFGHIIPEDILDIQLFGYEPGATERENRFRKRLGLPPMPD